MHDVRVINPLCHFFQQPVVPDIVKVGSQVKVEDARLPLDNCLGYSLDRVMCFPLGPVSKRSRLEIRLEDRFEYELERALHHPVPDRRYRKDADFAPILRYLLPPGWEWLVGMPRQFVPQLLEQSLRALRLNGLEGHPVYSRSPIVCLAISYAARRVSTLQTWTYSPQCCAAIRMRGRIASPENVPQTSRVASPPVFPLPH